MLRRIQRDQARLGMFVHAFDGPWLRHPFWRSRFLLSCPDALTRLIESDVPGLVIDERRGVPLAPPAPRPAPSRAPRPPVPAPAARAPERAPDRALATFDEERDRAARAALLARRAVRAVLDGVRAGRPVRATDVEAAADEIVASVHRHPHAMIGLTRLKTKDEYTFQHSVAVAALLVCFARHLGLSPRERHELGVAGLLHDLGKMVVPDHVLNKPGQLSDEEWALMRTHPEQGWRALADGVGVPAVALDVARHHHERFDGTGYPLKLAGEAISLHARMAAICDVYDAVTSRRAYKEAWSPAEAIARMRGWEGHFDPDLLFRFMGAIGVYPPGLLVRLRSNRLGLILDDRARGGRRESRARALAFFSIRDREMLPPQVVALGDTLAQDQAIAEERAEDWGIPDWPALKDKLLREAPKPR